MSQEKVDRYKTEKANRKSIMRKQRLIGYARKVALALVGLLLVVWLGYSARATYLENREREVATVNYNAVQDYLENLTATDTTAEEATE